MNSGPDLVGYKLMSRQIASLREAGGTTAQLLEGNQRLLQLSAFALMLIAVLALLAALYAVRFVAVPVVAGIVLGLIIGPIGDRERRRVFPSRSRFPARSRLFRRGSARGLADPASGADHWSRPARCEATVARIAGFDPGLDARFENLRSGGAIPPPVLNPAALPPATAPTSTVDFAATALAIVSPALSQAIIFLFSLTLFLASRAHWRSSLAMMFVQREHRLQALKSFSAIENQLTDYFLVVTGINLGLGLVVGAAFWIAACPVLQLGCARVPAELPARGGTAFSEDHAARFWRPDLSPISRGP